MAEEETFEQVGSGASTTLRKADLQKRMDKAFNEIEEVQEDVLSSLADLAAKEQHWAEMKARMDETSKKAASKIILDVGGKKFATSKTTLLRYPDSYFYALVASDSWKPERDGSYFIDRNPKYFDMVLDFLREGTLPITIKNLNEHEREMLKRHFDYFLLPLPAEFNSYFATVPCSSNLTIKGNIVSKSNGSGWNSGILGVTANPTKVSWRCISGSVIMIGLAPQNKFNVNDQNCHVCGYYIYVANGTLYSQLGDHGRAYLNRQITTTDTIDVHYNKAARQISFTISGANLGVAFTTATTEDLYPAAEFHYNNTSVEIVSVIS